MSPVQQKGTLYNPALATPGKLVLISASKLAKVIFTFKGILHQKIFYRLNLIFWIVMGCGIARFVRRGLKTTET